MARVHVYSLKRVTQKKILELTPHELRRSLDSVR